MSAAAVEKLLARLYTDERLRHEFLRDPRRFAGEAGLDTREIEAFEAIDRTGLELAAESYGHKRSGRQGRASKTSR